MRNKLIFVLGPTASGKTARAIELAEAYRTEIISCDSRQFYSELDIGVARPTCEELASATHHFIANRSVEDPYNVSTYEHEALDKLETLFEAHEVVIAVGGSGLYINALRQGISILPDPAPGLREDLKRQWAEEGLDSLRSMLKLLDPEYYNQVDLANGIRIQRALEVCLTTGKPYSQAVAQPARPRPFDIEAIVIERPREELRQRIDRRVDIMMQQGLEAEARSVYHLRHLNTLNTVGYKEFFSLWDEMGAVSALDPVQQSAVSDAIKLNTWHYAKKQLTWLKKYAIINP